MDVDTQTPMTHGIQDSNRYRRQHLKAHHFGRFNDWLTLALLPEDSERRAEQCMKNTLRSSSRHR